MTNDDQPDTGVSDGNDRRKGGPTRRTFLRAAAALPAAAGLGVATGQDDTPTEEGTPEDGTPTEGMQENGTPTPEEGTPEDGTQRRKERQPARRRPKSERRRAGRPSRGGRSCLTTRTTG